MKKNVSRVHRRQKLVKAHLGKDHRYGGYYFYRRYRDRTKPEPAILALDPSPAASTRNRLAIAVLAALTVPPVAFVLMYLFL